ncbi:MAG: hypothetical protein R3C61_01385 [Bacteroidia bacterium]
MNRLRYYLLLGILIAISTSVCGQKKDSYTPGYIITLGQDSLPGLVLLQDHVFNTTTCVFKVSNDGEEQQFSPGEIKGYGSGSSVFLSGYNAEGKDVFMQYKARGKFSLLYFRDEYYLKDGDSLESLILSQEKVKIEDRTFFKAREEYKYLLRDKMSDCFAINSYLKSTEFNLQSLAHLFEEYAGCSFTKIEVYKHETDKMKIRLGVAAGGMGSVLDFLPGSSARYVFAEFGSPRIAYTVVPSVLAEFSFPALTQRISFRTGATFYSATNEYERIREEPGITDIQHVTVTSSRLEIPLYLRYAFSKKGRGPYVIGGLGLDRFTRWDAVRVNTQSQNIVLRFENDLEQKDFFINYLIGAGADFQVGKRVVLVEAMHGFAPYLLDGKGTPMPTAWFQSVSISGGILF